MAERNLHVVEENVEVGNPRARFIVHHTDPKDARACWIIKPHYTVEDPTGNFFEKGKHATLTLATPSSAPRPLVPMVHPIEERRMEEFDDAGKTAQVLDLEELHELMGDMPEIERRLKGPTSLQFRRSV